MITKREKLKLNQQELYRQNIMSSLNRLTDQSLPMSVRRMDKLLSLCRLATNDHQVEEKDVKIKVEPSDIEHTIQPCSPSFDKNKIKLGPESDSDVDAKYIIKTVNTRSRSRKQ
jgi:hypothetical protein